MGGKTSKKKVCLNLCAVKVSHAEESLTVLFAYASKHGSAPERVHLHASVVVVVGDEVVIVTRSEEGGSILSDLVLLLPQI